MHYQTFLAGTKKMKKMKNRQVLLAVRHVEHPMNSRRKNKQPAVQHVEHLTSKKFI